MMARKTLVEQIDGMEFSEEGFALRDHLTSFSATDECGAVILVAAAILLAKEHPGTFGTPAATLDRLTAEFGELIYRVHYELSRQRAADAGLRVVGGTDVGGAA